MNIPTKFRDLLDAVEINLPNGIAFGTITFADIQSFATLALTVSSIITTWLLYRHKTKKDKNKDE